MSGVQSLRSPNFMIARKIHRVLAGLLCCTFLVSCITPSNQTATNTNWQIDSVASKCVMSIAGGAVLGAIIGAAAGGGGRSLGTGAAVGAAAGGVLCAVMAALDENDRARIKAAQLEAARTGKSQVLQYSGSDGLNRNVSIRVVDDGNNSLPEPVSRAPSWGSPKPTSTAKPKPPTANSVPASEAQVAAASGQRICRTLNTSVDIQSKGQADVPPQTVCRTPEGDWAPATA
ncbi:MAG: hypothetical protein NTZ72_19745 [Afipia sp.]|nr:hypothetical protein [Afipia sp.]